MAHFNISKLSKLDPLGLIDSLAEKISKVRYWEYFVIVMSLSITLFFSRPDYSLFFYNLKMPYGQALEWWLAHPFQKVPVENFFAAEDLVDGGVYFGCVSHCDKKIFRATIPILNIFFPFGLWTLLIATHIAGVAIFSLTYRIVCSMTGNKVQSALACLSLAATSAGAWAFHDFIYGDALAIALILASMFCKSRSLSALFCFLAMLTDERAVFSTLFVIVFKSLSLYSVNKSNLIKKLFDISIHYILVFVSYLSIRILIGFFTGYHTGSTMLFDINILRNRIYTDYPYEYFNIFEFLWFFVVLFLWFCLQKQKLLELLIYFLGLIGIILISCVVWDLERSVFYLWPGILVAITIPVGIEFRKKLWLCFSGNLIFFKVGHSVLVAFGALLSSHIK